MGELTAAMRQLRLAAGLERLEDAEDALNEAILLLYPGADRTTGGGVPHLVSGRYISDIERGNATKVKIPRWLDGARVTRRQQLRASHVPLWLVRAYDVAFLGDGYLVDVYRWALALHADQADTPPRASPTRRLTASGLAGFDRDTAVFSGAPPDIRRALDACRGQLTSYPAEPSQQSCWLPDERDRCTNINDLGQEIPEGVVTGLGEFLLGTWTLQNTGAVAWRNRLLIRTGRHDVGLRTPPFVPVPQTSPGETADVLLPVRTPDRPGTYRLCLRLGWPDGTYCYPNTLIGAIMTVIVLPIELAGCRREWSTS
jgi:hypothetical protein